MPTRQLTARFRPRCRVEARLTTQRLAASAVTLATVGVLVGCSTSDEGKNYDVPESLCGTSLDSGTIVELLPPGNKIDVQENNPVPSRKRCQVNVDGKAALRVSQEWWEEGDTVVDVAKGVPQVKSAELTDDSDSLLTGTGGCAESPLRRLRASRPHPVHHCPGLRRRRGRFGSDAGADH